MANTWLEIWLDASSLSHSFHLLPVFSKWYDRQDGLYLVEGWRFHSFTWVLNQVRLGSFRRAMLTLFSRKSILGCTQQVRDLSLLSRSGIFQQYFQLKPMLIFLLLAINTIKSLTPVPKTTANSYSLFYKEQFPEFKKQCKNISHWYATFAIKI